MDRLQAMETFVNVVDAGSFSGAARRLNVGQPAVSKTVAQLEEYLGVQLLLRSTRGLAPTEAGLGYYEGARRALAEAEDADVIARGANAGLSGRLKVSAAVTFARIHIMPYLQTFLDAHPQLSIDVVLDDRNIDLLENGIDVALRMGTLSDSNMTARRIAQGRRSVLATPEYLLRCGEPRAPAELAAHAAIVYDRLGGGGSWSFQQGETEVSVVVTGRVRVSAAEGVREAVLANMGLVVTSDWMFAPELANGKVRRVMEDWTLAPIDLWAVYPSGRKASAKARAFTAFVEATMAGAV
ncbi:LysR family transcriptional regulator [Rugamonas sp.]|uniref:LysR family transcriptional regulator n=1 Tax=Rugamonas sp. TaxID=1926287 RepID=UPI0025DBE624|nr:LysR family transcriptional regulator [Rugamonas sp.]